MKDNWVSNYEHSLKLNNFILRADFQSASWKFVICSMISYAFAPIIVPVMILLSKLLKRPIDWRIEE